MINYIMEQLNKNEYYLICLNYFGFLNYIKDIEKENLILNNEGILIIDQLLVTGDSNNRFISCDFSKGKIKLDTAKNIIGNYKLKKITSDILKMHYSELRYSVLNEIQLTKIYNGQAV